MIRAAKLDVSLYEEVEADEGALGQANLVVILSSLAAGIGMIWSGAEIRRGPVIGLLAGTLASLIAWYIWAFLTYFIGTKLFPEPQTSATYGELLRTSGFSSSPGLISILGILPFVGLLISAAAGIWMLMAMVIAVRQALDYHSTLRAVGVCIVGWIVGSIVKFAMLGVVFATVYKW
jgi:hypothetical protein